MPFSNLLTNEVTKSVSKKSRLYCPLSSDAEHLSKKTDSILFIKVENDGFDLGAQRRPTDKNDLPMALKYMTEYKNSLKNGDNVEGSEVAHVAKKSKIEESGEWNLSSERYRKKSFIKSAFEWMPLETLTEYFLDGDWVESKDQSAGGIRLIQTGNVGLGEYLDKSSRARYISEEKFDELNCKEVFPGDVLISRLPDPVGRACMVPKMELRMITAVDCTIVRFQPDKLLPELFVEYTKSDSYYKNIFEYLTGSSRRRISRSNLGKVMIPVPPIAIQKEIVAELEGYQIEIQNIEKKKANLNQKIENKIAGVWGK